MNNLKKESSPEYGDVIEDFLFNKYHDEISEIKYDEVGYKSIVIDFNELSMASSEFADRLIEEPYETIKMIESKIDLMFEVKGKPIKVKINNLIETVPLEKVLAETIGELIETEGIVRRVGTAKAEITKPVFECRACFRQHIGECVEGELISPMECVGCQNKEFRLLLPESEKGDVQNILLEPLGNTTNRYGKPVVLRNDLVNSVEAGQKIKLTGIVYIGDVGDDGTYPIYLEANHIETNDEMLDFEITPEDIKEIEELSNKENIIELLADSLAPDITGNLEIKKSMLYAIVGGSKNPKNRDKIHVLIISDPSMGKTKIGKNASEVSKIRYVSGTSATGVGITAGVSQEKGNEWVLEAGALVLSNGETVIIDEFDKLRLEEQKTLLTPMENGSIPINKAGINTELSANTGIIALANPKEGKFDKYKSLKEQSKVYPPLATRFDLIMLMEDKPDEDNDFQIADTILNQYSGETEIDEELISKDLLRKYVHYAKLNYNPILSKELKERMKNDYTGLRKKVGSIVPRHLQAMARITQAISKLKLKDVCDESDYEEAYSMFKNYIDNFAYDDETESYDMGKIDNNDLKSKEKREKALELLKDYLNKSLYTYIKKSKLVKLYESELKCGNSTAYNIIDDLIKNNRIVNNNGKISLVEKS